ncbi:MAG: TIGR03619 family F420-dependent LLM class oxidoreductase [Chloroflexi bacterium]|nr:TIGR03619 family F420-dependent LLM class oxidoreductase [Chloroflexota bacterium]
MSLRIGANLAEPALTASHARLAEEAGFDFVGAGEHVYRDERPGPTQIALSALATAAGATSRVGLLTSIVIAPLHHPVMLAKEAAIVDLASGGRLTIGLGVGGEFPGEFAALGIPLNQRGARTDETVEILRALWSGGPATHAGKLFSFKDVTLDPGPAQPGGPKIWIGGRTEAAMKRTARMGDGWLPYLYRPSQYARSVDTVKGLLARYGRRDDAFGWGLHLMTAVAGTREESVRLAAESLRAGYKYDGSYEELAERYVLLGPPDAAIASLLEFHKSGARDVLLSWMVPSDRISEQIESIGQNVIPHLKSV